jgi:DNA-binding transcriptional MerR regulator
MVSTLQHKLEPSGREMHISQAARRLGVTPTYLRILEKKGRIPPARRDLNGRVYTEYDLALLRSIGVGQRLPRLKRAEEVLESTS